MCQLGPAQNTDRQALLLQCLSTTFCLLLKSKIHFLPIARLTCSWYPSHPGYKVLKFPNLLDLYSGFAVWLCGDVRLYFAPKIVGGGQPAADRCFPCPLSGGDGESRGAPYRGLIAPPPPASPPAYSPSPAPCTSSNPWRAWSRALRQAAERVWAGVTSCQQLNRSRH